MPLFCLHATTVRRPCRVSNFSWAAHRENLIAVLSALVRHEDVWPEVGRVLDEVRNVQYHEEDPGIVPFEVFARQVTSEITSILGTLRCAPRWMIRTGLEPGEQQIRANLWGTSLSVGALTKSPRFWPRRSTSTEGIESCDNE